MPLELGGVEELFIGEESPKEFGQVPSIGRKRHPKEHGNSDNQGTEEQHPQILGASLCLMNKVVQTPP